ncbi:MAG: hypothetical protein RBQ99_05245 [Trichlorobacter sp.]|jgi:hypothetical protein|nr:hypothetical protein [Trichlorobacter sp.]
MPYKFVQKILQHLQLREAWVIFFVLGNVMINFPFLRIFNQPVSLFGYPLMFWYFTFGWGASIFVVYLFTITLEDPAEKQDNHEKQV